MLNMIAPLGVSPVTREVLEEALAWIIRRAEQHPDVDRDPVVERLLSSARKVCSAAAEDLTDVLEGAALLRFLAFAGDVARHGSDDRNLTSEAFDVVLSELGDLRRRAGYLLDHLARDFRMVGNPRPAYRKEAS